ncbi:hypothetical protein Pmani_018897 [Petrolisthes manimaculis]|uniref:Uncharacterized protein n=1 Tax=Petrolisthes manimaculis TaxID=1843537 RepID=A0AAE1PJE0_9EUCA|nr:hypothetical protein Pmani_018897 [Petrolisthes manimaculis]
MKLPLSKKPLNKPMKPFTKTPAESTVRFPAESPFKSSSRFPSAVLVPRTPPVIAASPVEIPAESVAEIPAESVAEIPAESVAEIPAESTNEIPAESTNEISAELITRFPSTVIVPRTPLVTDVSSVEIPSEKTALETTSRAKSNIVPSHVIVPRTPVSGEEIVNMVHGNQGCRLRIRLTVDIVLPRKK